MKFAIVATILAAASLTASAAVPLTAKDLTATAKNYEHDKKSISKLKGKEITLTLKQKPQSIYFEFDADPGIVVLCPQSSRGFNGGTVTAKILDFELDADSGHEFVNVLKLSSCAAGK